MIRLWRVMLRKQLLAKVNPDTSKRKNWTTMKTRKKTQTKKKARRKRLQIHKNHRFHHRYSKYRRSIKVSCLISSKKSSTAHRSNPTTTWAKSSREKVLIGHSTCKWTTPTKQKTALRETNTSFRDSKSNTTWMIPIMKTISSWGSSVKVGFRVTRSQLGRKMWSRRISQFSRRSFLSIRSMFNRIMKLLQSHREFIS